MQLTFSPGDSKQEIFSKVEEYLVKKNFRVIAKDFNRPWGGFFVIDETQAKAFAEHFFPTVPLEELKISGKLSPKILMVQPDKRLSWQYHHRRAEIWRLIAGEAAVVISDTDQEKERKELSIGEIVRLECGERHRLVGSNNWGMVSEIWQHTEANDPSDENDIVRLQDDFGR